jgi:hypothetical protein
MEFHDNEVVELPRRARHSLQRVERLAVRDAEPVFEQHAGGGRTRDTAALDLTFVRPRLGRQTEATRQQVTRNPDGRNPCLLAVMDQLVLDHSRVALHAGPYQDQRPDCHGVEPARHEIAYDDHIPSEFPT